MSRQKMLRPFVGLGLVLALTACNIPVSPQQAADRCEDRARAAQAPEGSLSIGTNSNTGPFASASVSVSSDFVRGTDPVALYESCVFNLTGELPIRPPRLRDL